MVTRGLGAEGAAPVAVLWTYWGACTAFLTFPLQHWLIRSLQADDPATTGDGLRRLARWVGGFAVLAAAAAWLLADPLFGDPGPTWPLLVGVVTVGTFLTGAVRGALAGRGRFTATAVALAADNLVRVVLAGAVLLAGGGAVAVGIALALGATVELLWAAALRLPRHGGPAATSPLRLFGTVATASALAQLVLVGGPVVVPFVGGTAQQVTVLFVTLALFRAPYLLALGLANQLTGPLTRWQVDGATRQLRRFHATVAVATVVGAPAALVVGRLVGPALVALVFGADARPSTAVAGQVAAGSLVAVGNLVLTLAVIGEGRGGRLARTWALAGVVALAVLAVPQPTPLLRVTAAFVAGQVVAFALLLVTGWRRLGAVTARHGRSP